MTASFEFERDRAYSRLVKLIFDRAPDADTALSERKLTEQLGIGRMPVREALRQLEREGVVEVRPARGTFVCRLSPEDLGEVYRLREALEGLAAQLAAERGMTARLSGCGARMRIMARDPSAFTSGEIDDIGTEFHEALTEAAGNAPLAEMIRLMRMRSRLAFHLPRYFAHDLMHDILVEHIAVFDAIDQGKPRLAQRLMRRHLRRGLDLRLKLDVTPRVKQQHEPEVYHSKREELS